MLYRFELTRDVVPKQKAKCRGGSRGEHKRHVPPKPQVIFTNIIQSCTILQVYGHYGNVPFKRLALLGPAAIVDYFAGSGACRLRCVF